MRSVVVGKILQHGRRHGKDQASGSELAPRKDVVDQKSMDATVPVLERMQKDESIRHGGGVDHGWDVTRIHPHVGRHQSVHPSNQVLGFWADKMDLLLLWPDSLSHVVLFGSIIGVAETRIDDAILHVEQTALVAEVLKCKSLPCRIIAFTDRDAPVCLLRSALSFPLKLAIPGLQSRTEAAKGSWGVLLPLSGVFAPWTNDG